METGKCGTVDLENMDEAPKEPPTEGRRGSTVRADVIMEEGSEADPSSEASSASDTKLPVCVLCHGNMRCVSWGFYLLIEVCAILFEN